MDALKRMVAQGVQDWVGASQSELYEHLVHMAGIAVEVEIRKLSTLETTIVVKPKQGGRRHFIVQVREVM